MDRPALVGFGSSRALNVEAVGTQAMAIRPTGFRIMKHSVAPLLLAGSLFLAGCVTRQTELVSGENNGELAATIIKRGEESPPIDPPIDPVSDRPTQAACMEFLARVLGHFPLGSALYPWRDCKTWSLTGSLPRCATSIRHELRQQPIGHRAVQDQTRKKNTAWRADAGRDAGQQTQCPWRRSAPAWVACKTSLVAWMCKSGTWLLCGGSVAR